MYLLGWDLILFVLSHYLLKIVSVMNEPYYHKKSSPILQMFYRTVGVVKGVVKNFANFTGKYLCQVKYKCKSLTLSMKPVPSL